MSDLPSATRAVLGAIVAIGVLGVLHVLAAAMRNEAHVQDVRARVVKLKRDYAKRHARGADDVSLAEGPASLEEGVRKAA